jgi:hypothetical protein
MILNILHAILAIQILTVLNAVNSIVLIQIVTLVNILQDQRNAVKQIHLIRLVMFAKQSLEAKSVADKIDILHHAIFA